MAVRVKRVYERFATQDGFRVLVDRVWPRGLGRERARIDLWAKELAPSASLRKWFAHDPAKWREFRRRYFGELRGREDELAELIKDLRRRARRGRVTLLFAARDEEHNNAVALKEFLDGKR